jgi:hypothetical protein
LVKVITLASSALSRHARANVSGAIICSEECGCSFELLASEFERTWPDAAASLREGVDETLTLMSLGIAGQLAKKLCSTNP